MLEKMRNIANAHPFWSPLLSVKNMCALALIYGSSVIYAIVVVANGESGKHTLSIIGMLLVPVGVSIVCAQMVYRDYRMLRQARYMVENAAYFVSQLEQHEITFMLYLIGAASRGGFPHGIKDFENLCHRDQLRFCLEYIKFLKYTKRTQSK